MGEELRRRFSLDKANIDPSLKNRIFSADGDEEVGSWNGENIQQLVEELDRIEERVDANYGSLPLNQNIPEDLRNQVEKDFPVWACDRSGLCLTGENATDIVPVEEIRKHYVQKYGGIDQYKEKLRLEREKMIENLNYKKKK